MAKRGVSCVIELQSTILERPIPNPMPSSDEVVNCETDLPAMSAILFYLANLMLIYAREAAAMRKQIFFIIFAVEANNKNRCGNLSVIISIKIDRFKDDMAKNLHFLMSSSK